MLNNGITFKCSTRWQTEVSELPFHLHLFIYDLFN